jgi:hypothetical protein
VFYLLHFWRLSDLRSDRFPRILEAAYFHGDLGAGGGRVGLPLFFSDNRDCVLLSVRLLRAFFKSCRNVECME